MLAKSRVGLAHLRHRGSPARGTRILALVETARGLQHVEQIASASSTFRIAFGTGDFRRDTATGDDPIALAYARSQLVVASRAARRPAPIDGPTLDSSQLLAGTQLAKQMGMSGKLCLSHEQTDTINAGLSPSHEDVACRRSASCAPSRSRAARSPTAPTCRGSHGRSGSSRRPRTSASRGRRCGRRPRELLRRPSPRFSPNVYGGGECDGRRAPPPYTLVTRVYVRRGGLQDADDRA